MSLHLLMRFDIITIFPKIFNSYFRESIIGRAQKKGKISIYVHNLRDYTEDKHQTVDDRPYGGGPGMILKVEPLVLALKTVLGSKLGKKDKFTKVILLTPKGKTYNQNLAKNFLKLKRIILVAGHYEGFDQRIRNFVDLEISIGNYILTGGEIPAMVVVDSLTRLIRGVLGDKDSTREESFSPSLSTLEYPHYTRPEIFSYKNKKMKVPKILLSGDHKKIALWRQRHMKKKNE